VNVCNEWSAIYSDDSVHLPAHPSNIDNQSQLFRRRASNIMHFSLALGDPGIQDQSATVAAGSSRGQSSITESWSVDICIDSTVRSDYRSLIRRTRSVIRRERNHRGLFHETLWRSAFTPGRHGRLDWQGESQPSDLCDLLIITRIISDACNVKHIHQMRTFFHFSLLSYISQKD